MTQMQGILATAAKTMAFFPSLLEQKKSPHFKKNDYTHRILEQEEFDEKLRVSTNDYILVKLLRQQMKLKKVKKKKRNSRYQLTLTSKD